MKKILVLLICLSIFIPTIVSAAISDDPSYFPYNDQVENKNNPDYFSNPENQRFSCLKSGNCSIDQTVNTFVVLTKLGLGSLGSISLLFFIVGGFMWMTASGNKDRIDKGKKIMTNTVIGIVIVLAAWLIVQTILTSISNKTLQGLDGTSQTEDLCLNGTLQEGDSCRGNLGFCQSGVCVEKCIANKSDNSPDYKCREYTECNQNSILRMQCFGASNIVCCQPE